MNPPPALNRSPAPRQPLPPIDDRRARRLADLIVTTGYRARLHRDTEAFVAAVAGHLADLMRCTPTEARAVLVRDHRAVPDPPPNQEPAP